VTRRRMTAAGFLSLPADYRLGSPDDNPRALTPNPDTGATELWPVEIAEECWHRLYVEVDLRDRTVWEIQRLDGGGEYRILRNLAEVGTRRGGWDAIRAQFCNLARPICPDLDEPQVAALELSFVVTHGSRKCEVGRGVVSNESEALSYSAAVFEMDRKRRADDYFRRLLHGGSTGW
jgi:hypothetical protein